MTAEAMGISAQALTRWQRTREAGPAPPTRRGRPEVIPPQARKRIRDCYRAHHRQWGPRILAWWARREDLGDWSPTTIAHVIADLRPAPAAEPPPRRYEVTATGVMWSEDGAGFRERRRRRELLIAQDEHARFKVATRLVAGPATERQVHDYLLKAFHVHGPPLVLKHDGGSIFHAERVQGLLRDWGVLDLTSPPRYPPYNGKKERSIRDLKSFERAMRRDGHRGRLADRVDTAVHDLNEERPRPVLGGRTAREAFERDRRPLPDRNHFRKEVDRTERRLRVEATTRSERDSARRHAIEQVLMRHGLLDTRPDVSANSHALSWTN